MGKKNKETLGRALIKDRFAKTRNRKHVENNSMLHTAELNDGYDWGRLNLQSVTAESSLQEFLATAELAQREFIADKFDSRWIPKDLTIAHYIEKETSQPDFSEPLLVPRRPAWQPGVSAEEQLNNERESFLNWRRNLNELQVKLGAALTPYERNIELWKQLWRTLEKSDVVLLLLDARNPLLFRCADLEAYAKEQKCRIILLLNKADLISEYDRKCWADYFSKQKVSIMFFSAAKPTSERKLSEASEDLIEQDETIDSETESADSDLDDVKEEKPTIPTDEDIELFKGLLKDIGRAVNDTSDKVDSIQRALDKVIEKLRMGIPIDDTEDSADKEVENPHEIYDREKLVEVLKKHKVGKKKNPPRLSVGLIGYPNVGKSSTVNILMQTKKVSVSSMPGHTRHIQSLILDDDIELLDCPGLVLPAYAVAPDLLLTAVLPIDQMRSYDGAVARLCQMVSKQTFVEKYGLLLPEGESQDPDYKQILTAHAFNRGFMTAAGQPDQARSARLILKEAASGRLRWSQLPPGCDPQPIDGMVQEKRNEKRKPTPREARLVEGWLNKSSEIDSAFFAMQKSTAHVKGKPIVGIVGAQPASNQIGKPWKQEKKHANKNKREKLRKVYSHLDEH